MRQAEKEKLAYLIGVALGDGNLSNPNGRAIRLRVSCFTGYPKIITEIEKTIQALLPKNKVSISPRRGRCVDISVYSNKLAEWMPWVTGKGSKITQNVRVPEWIRTNQTFSKACLRGLIQTDGCIYIDRGYPMVNFTNSCKPLALDVKQMIDDLGFRPNVYILKTRLNPKYNVRVSRDAKLFVRTLKLAKA